jgi:uncharacterized protein (TIGR02145 family)
MKESEQIIYFEQERPDGNGLCSLDSCPCGSFGSEIPRGKGYLFIPESAVNYRKDCLTNYEFQKKLQNMLDNLATGSNLVFTDVPVLVCEKGINKLGIDIAVAQSDAKYWWETGLIPLRPSPKIVKPEIPTKSQLNNNNTLYYDSVAISKHRWMIKNLDVDRFSNGDVIKEIKSDYEWMKAYSERQPAWCYFENNSEYKEKFGKLYNWYAVTDPRGLAPKGWHIPNEIEILIDLLPYILDKCSKLLAEEQPLSSYKGSNTTGFGALLYGSRFIDGKFSSLGNFTEFWSSAVDKNGEGYSMKIYDDDSKVKYDIEYKGQGCSVRCIKD